MREKANSYSKDFKLMIVGQIISVFGAALLRFALSLYILDITGRADMFAALYAVSNIPILLSPLGGAIADRFNRRNLMVLFDFTSSLVVMFLFLLISAGLATVTPIGVIMVLLSIISAMETPTVTASIPLLVKTEKLESANGIAQAVQALSGVAAPILGGMLYSTLEIRFLVIITCITFFLSAVMELFIKIPFARREWDGHIIVTIVKDMKAGFVYVVKQPFILKSMIVAAAINLVLSPLLIVGSPIILRVTMQSSDTMQGIGVGLISFASILGTLTIGVFAKRIKVKTLHRFIAAIALLAVPIAVSVFPFILELGYYPAFTLFMLGAIPIAMVASIISIYVIARVQRVTSNDNLGKVMAIIMAVAGCAAPIGQVIYGVVFESFSDVLYFPILAVSLLMLVIAFVARRMFSTESNS
ncbi:MFS transporter [Konateibacter massiliensis]|uniref:MFS transporter n=1 Tax=Konateibacter massiliensis TaxID=2002841 RepID=UPI000C157395|nr:MFS transporter [Konateibacter massiliensis]